MAIEVIKVTDGTQTPIGFDQVGTVYEQVIKLDISADGAASAILYDGKVQGGTINAATVAGGSIAVTAGTVNVTAFGADIPGGTIDLVTRVGNVGTLEVGTISILPNIPGGTLGLITRVGNLGTVESGTLTSVGSVSGVGGTVMVDIVAGDIVASLGTINSGTITRVEQGSINVTAATITAGSIRVTVGTTGGAVASGAAAVGNPNIIAGTDSGGTVYSFLTDTTGHVKADILTGTVTNVGSVVGIGSVSNVAFIHNAGTIAALPDLTGRTVDLVTTVSNLTNGSVRMTVGTLTVMPNVPGGTLGVVSSLTTGSIIVTNGTVAAGTVGGKAASGVVISGNPIPVGGTDSGGTVYSFLTDTLGHMKVDMVSGTLNVGTVTTSVQVGTINVGTINTGTINAGTVDLLKAGTVTRLEQGSVNVTVGTIGGKAASGAVAVANPVFIAGTDPGGTVYGLRTDTAGVLQINGTVSTGGAGTQAVRLVDGTLTRVEGGTLGLITRVGNIGTLEVGTVTIGAVNSIGTLGTLQLGTVVVNAGTNVIGNVGLVDSSGIYGLDFIVTQTDGASDGLNGLVASSFGYYHNGTNWDRVRGDLTNGLLVNLGANNDAVITAGTITHGTIDVGTITVGTVYKGVPAPAAGSLTAAGTVTVAGSQNDTVYWEVGGTWVGTAFFEGQVGTSTYFAVPVTTPLGVIGTQTTSNGAFLMSATGLDNTRLRVTYSSGTLTHNERASNFFSNLSYIMAGSVTNMGSVSNIGQLYNAGTIQTILAGTINNSGTTTGVGVVSMLSAGTVTKLEQGSINVTAGTITAGTLTALANGTVTAGSIRVTLGTVVGAAASGAAASGGPVLTGGTDGGGTVYSFLTDTTGHMKADLLTGTVTSVGSVTGVGVVTNLTSGSVRMTVGTLTVMPNVPGGTLGLLQAGTISMLSAGTVSMLNAGTLTTIPNIPGGTIGVVSSLTTGSIAVTAGTVIMTNGTIGAGTVVVSAATIAAGTISARNTENILTYCTQFAATAAAYATLVGSASVGSGTSLYMQNFNLINPAGTVLALLGLGTALNGTSVLFRGILGTQTVGGIQKSWDKPVNAGMTNQDLVVYLGAAGTVDVTVSYFIKV